MAMFKQLKSGWQARVRYYDKNGERKSISKNGFRTKAMASKWADSVKSQYRSGGNLEKRNVSLIDYFLEWYQTFREPKLSVNSKHKYIQTIHVIENYFGQTGLRDITPSGYQKFLNFYGKGDETHPGHAKATIETINTHIKGAVKNALNDGIIQKDFTLTTNLVFDASKTREVKYLNQDDAKTLLKFLKGHLFESVVYPMAYTSLMTGMRVSEVAGLTWDCIDRENLKLTINKAWNFSTLDFGPTKNKASKRVIDINSQLAKMFAEVKFHQNTALKAHGKPNPKNNVFLTNRFVVPNYRTMEKMLRVALKKAGIKQDLTFHSLRHTHASLLLYDRIAIPYISKRLGHQDVNTTIKIYLHIIQELQNEESKKTISYMNKLEEMSN